jgi:hypothetical protein
MASISSSRNRYTGRIASILKVTIPDCVTSQCRGQRWEPVADKVHYREQIDRILSSHALHGSESLCKLLRYLVARSLWGSKSFGRRKDLGRNLVLLGGGTGVARGLHGACASGTATRQAGRILCVGRCGRPKSWSIFREARMPWLFTSGREGPGRNHGAAHESPTERAQTPRKWLAAVILLSAALSARRRSHHGLPLEVARYGAGGFKRGSSPAAVLNSSSAPALSPFLSSAKPSW